MKANATAASRIVGVNEKTVRRWIQAGQLAYTRKGRENLVLVSDVRRLAAASGAGAARAKYRHLFGRLYWRCGTPSEDTE